MGKKSGWAFQTHCSVLKKKSLLKILIKIRKFQEKSSYASNLHSTQNKAEIFWSKVAQEYNKNIEQIRNFKTGKQCKERWNNHINPVLIKYLIFYLFFVKKNWFFKFLEKIGVLLKIFNFWRNFKEHLKNGPKFQEN